MNKKIVTLIIILLGAILAFLSDYLPSVEEQMNIAKTDTIAQMEELLRVNFIDVGQGDSTLIELPNGEILLIDAGNPEDGEYVAGIIAKKGYTRIDYLIATHPHSDHIGGMAEVVKSLEIGKIYMPKKSHNTSSFEKLVNAISDKNLSITEAKAGVNVLDKENLKINILSPQDKEYDDLNNYSVVVKVNYGDTSFLFAGDAEKQIEYKLLDSGMDLKADVLKVSHHGSSTSSSGDFINAVNPEYAVISCGEGNDYGHPHSSVLNLLNKNNISILRTDKMGSIVICSNGSNLEIEKSE